MKKLITIKQFLVIMFFAVVIVFSYDMQKNAFINIELGQVIESDITAHKTIEYVDQLETQLQKEMALSQIQEVYEKNDAIIETLLLDVAMFIESVNLYKNEYAVSKEIQANAVVGGNTKSVALTEDDYINKIENPFELTNEELKYFFHSTESNLGSMRDVFSNELRKIYNVGISKEQIDAVKNDFRNNSNFYFFNSQTRESLIKAIVERIEPNMILNEEETKKRYEESKKSILDVTKTVKRGEVVLRKGEIVGEEDLAVLAALGYSKTAFDLNDTLKRFPLVLLVMFMLHSFLIKFNYKEVKSDRVYVMVFATLMAMVGLNQMFQNEYLVYILMLLFIMIVVTFLNPRIAIVYSISLGILVNVNDLQVILTALVMGVVVRLAYDQKAGRSAMLNLGLFTNFTLIMVHTAVSLFTKTPIIFNEFYPYIISPIVASMLAVGVFPYLEVLLGMVTPVKLHELTSPNHHLTKRIINEIPGTYHHSLRVGQLGEAAADKIGANGLLVKVAAIFHDVGKLKNPKYFVENLNNGDENPHDKLSPKESVAIIRQHPIDSVLLCKKYGIPAQITEIIEKHHGDDAINYFYVNAVNDNDGVEIKKEDFRYATPLPISKEDGILMLADIAEASSRAFIHEDHEVARKKLTDIIHKKIEDKQLRECALTMKEINIIIDTFLQFLMPSAHKRPAYPEIKK